MDKDLERLKKYLERRIKHSTAREKDSDSAHNKAYWGGNLTAYENALDLVETIMREKTN